MVPFLIKAMDFKLLAINLLFKIIDVLILFDCVNKQLRNA